MALFMFVSYEKKGGLRSPLESAFDSAFAAAAIPRKCVWTLTSALVVEYLLVYNNLSANGIHLFYVHDPHPDREWD